MSALDNAEPRTEGIVPGIALRAARAAQNLSVADVARQLKLSVGQIEALEAGAFDRLPGPVFVRGFIRNYARLLKIDPDGILRFIESDREAPQVHDDMPPAQDIPYPAAVVRRWPKYALAALLVTAGLVAYEFYWNEPEPLPATNLSAGPGVIVPRPALPAQETPLAAGTTAAPPVSQDANPADPPAVQQAGNATKPQLAALPESGTSPQSGEAEVRLVFDDNSWVQIRDRSGKAIFSRLNPGGTEQRVSGSPPFTLVVGNARGVRLTYNDRPVDLERYIKVDVARLTLE
jgi:cytoskeleton protein RodZ